MPIEQLSIKSNIRNYNVDFCGGSGFIHELLSLSPAVFVVDDKVWDFHSNGCLSPIKKLSPIILPISEERKNLSSVENLYDQIVSLSPKKNLSLVVIGGGITQDLVGFAASTLYRGIKWHFVPTTLLAQADSCIGAKTSLNYKSYKNLIGTFYPPMAVYIYPQFLRTQNEVDYFSGVGEVVKLHLMGGAADAQRLIDIFPEVVSRKEEALKEVIGRSLSIKKNYIEEDEFDSGRRNLLNFGHCFGHAIETATAFAVSHGQAVIMGIILANLVSVEKGMLSRKSFDYLLKNLLMPSLKVDLKKLVLDEGKIIAGMKQDKKRTGAGLALVLMQDNYAMSKIEDLTEADAISALFKFKEFIPAPCCKSC